MANPPSNGIGSRCTLRGPGKSTIPTRKARARTGTARTKEANSAIENAIKLAAIHPQLFEPLCRQGRVRRFCFALCRVGVRLPSNSHCPTVDLYPSAEIRSLPSVFSCRAPFFQWQTRLEE